MNKKTLIIIAIVLGIIALGIGAYFAWKNREKIAEVIPEIVGGSIAPIEQKVEKLAIVSSREVAGYWSVSNASSTDIWYVAENGNVVKIDAQGIEEIINKETFSGIGGVIAPKNGNTAMLSSVENGRATYRVYNMQRNEWLLANGEAASLSPDGTLVASIIKGVLANAQLLIQDADLLQTDNENQKNIISLAGEGFDIGWVKANELFLTQRPSADYISDMWRVDIKTKKLSKFLSDRGLMVRWSPLGDRALKFTTTEGRQHKLSIIDEKGMELMILRFITLPDKCVFATPTQMYCAISRDQEALSHMVLPDEYLKRDVYFQDGIYQIDLTTNGIRAIYEDESPIIDATKLTLLDDKILFINRYDRKLYSLKLQ